ncbi:IclR family transcriptional regulator [Williamsia serinedens]|uniref:Transcriptional regulator, IclR family n=1 Tax=Williamsia serinedens TaxID=391736 RepID=A0ABT1H479_9NOCA|nr:IclR family transcriptional regulator [Williamsia serinedens]MCP2160642.1 transcriptional regulator, IclR family [Williamsia serinedens]
MAGRSPAGVSVVARALSVLGAFDERHRVLTLSEIATRADLPAPTALRLIRQLVEGEVLERTDDGAYVVGRRVWRLGLLAPVQTDLRDICAPYLQDLQAATRATVHLAVREGHETLYLERLAGRRSVPVVSKVGSRLPLHCTGVGKVLLAWAPDEVHHHVLRHLTRQTPHTITAPAMLTTQLARVRREGYATTVEEMSLGACSLAVPVHGPDGDVVAALGVVVPSLDRERTRLSAAATVAAQGIGRELARAAEFSRLAAGGWT